MASIKGGKCKRGTYRAKLATQIGPCVFCQRAVDDEIVYGKLYDIGDIQCHYFCALLSCCLIQKVSEEEGLFGFRYQDILAEVERSKKHKCSYCNRDGANIGCCVSQCRKQFHLPCGRERNAVSLFYGNYKSFCVAHAPKQKVAEALLPKVRLRIAEERKRDSRNKRQDLKCDEGTDESVCVICYEAVPGRPGPGTFWPACCARDAWLHRHCLQRMALNAGMHYLKCPLCNDKETFYRAVLSQGYYVPDRDAAWELEQGAFADIYERPAGCSAPLCKCPHGTGHNADSGSWELKLCILCGSTGVHNACTDREDAVYICNTCQPAAPEDMDGFIAGIENVQLQEQASEARRGPPMPSRMSIRRTKRRALINSCPSTSRILVQTQENSQETKTTESSRLELCLKSPKRRDITAPPSPMKLLEALRDRVPRARLEALRDRLGRPGPRVAKIRVANKILEEFFSTCLKDPKSREPLKEWNSPKKICDITNEDCKENIKTEDSNTPLKTSNEKSPIKTIILEYGRVSNDFICSFKHKHIDNKIDSSGIRTAIDFAMDAYENNQINKENTEIRERKRRFIDHDDGKRQMDGKRRRIERDGDVREMEDEGGSEEKRQVIERDDRSDGGQAMEDNEISSKEKETKDRKPSNEKTCREDKSGEKRQIDKENSKEEKREVITDSVLYRLLYNNVEKTQLVKDRMDSEERKEKIEDQESNDEKKPIRERSEEKTQIIQRDNVDKKSPEIKDKRKSSEERQSVTDKRNRIDRKGWKIRDRDNAKDRKRRRVTRRDGLDRKRHKAHRNTSEKSSLTIGKGVDEELKTTERDDDSEIRMIDREDDIIKTHIKTESDCMNDVIIVDETQNVDVIDLTNTNDDKIEREDVRKRRKNYRLKIKSNKANLENENTSINNLTDISDFKCEKIGQKKDIPKKKKTGLRLKKQLKDKGKITEFENKNDKINDKFDFKGSYKNDDLDFKDNNKSDEIFDDEINFKENNKFNVLHKQNKKKRIDFKDNNKSDEIFDNEINFKENNKFNVLHKQNTKKRLKSKKCPLINLNEKSEKDKNIEIDSKRKKSKRVKELKVKYKKSEKLSIQNRGFKVKIKWRKQQLNLKITDERKAKSKLNTKVLKQYLLKYSPEATSSKDFITKPEGLTPIRKKYIKTEKHTDNLIQTNISSFFKPRCT